jgi:acyl carrier protein
MATTFEAIAKIVADEADIDIGLVTPGARWNEIGIDSLGLIPVLVRCECDFLCQLPDRDIELLSTVGELAALVEKHRRVSA